jgi:hypothetical protein
MICGSYGAGSATLGKRYLILEQLDLLKSVEGVSLPLRVAIDHELANRLQLVSQLNH